MKSLNTLHGRLTYKQLFTDGLRVQGNHLRCYVSSQQTSRGSLSFGVSVPGGKISAVQRNTIKRRLRSAFRSSCTQLVRSCVEKGSDVRVVLVPIVRRGSKMKIPSFKEIQTDMTTLLAGIVSRLRHG